MAQMAMEELHRKEQDLQVTKGELARLNKELLQAKEKHAADISRLTCDHLTAVTKLSDEHAADTARRADELRQEKEKHAADIAELSDKHAADIAELSEKLAAEVRAVKVQCQRDLIRLRSQNHARQKEKYDMGLKDMRELVLNLCPGVVLPSELKHVLLYDSDLNHEDNLEIISAGDSEDGKQVI